jgi:hypothetical protein
VEKIAGRRGCTHTTGVSSKLEKKWSGIAAAKDGKGLRICQMEVRVAGRVGECNSAEHHASKGNELRKIPEGCNTGNQEGAACPDLEDCLSVTFGISFTNSPRTVSSPCQLVASKRGVPGMQHRTGAGPGATPWMVGAVHLRMLTRIHRRSPWPRRAAPVSCPEAGAA